MIWWTGLAPWKFEFPFPGSLIFTFLGYLACAVPGSSDDVCAVDRKGHARDYSSSLSLSTLELLDTQVYEP